MTTIQKILADSDPVHGEPLPASARRDAIRRAAIAAAASRPAARTGPSRRAFVLGGGTAVAVVALGVSRPWLPGEVTLHAEVPFEVHLADTAARGAARDAVHDAGGRTIYLEPEAVLTNDDVASAHVVEEDTHFGVAVEFTDAGAAKMREATAGHAGSLLAIVVDGKVIASPRITSTIDRVGVLTGSFTKAEATRIATGIVKR